MSVLAVVVGAMWAVYQFTVQQQQRLEQLQREDLFRRQERIIAAIDDLNDPAKRNTAAYALAILAEEEALPLLLAQFRETIGPAGDAAFRQALAQSLILIGEPALPPLLDLNRQAGTDLSLADNRAIVTATEPILLHYLMMDKRLLSAGTHDLSGVVILEVNLGHQNLEGLHLEGVRLLRNNFCGADLSSSWLGGAVVSGGQMGNARLDGADLSRAVFRDVRFDGSVTFQAVNAPAAEFAWLDLSGADFHQAKLGGATFSNAHLYRARFTEADLQEVDFTAAYLQQADFSGSNLSGAIFFPGDGETARPGILPPLRTAANDGWFGTGAYVKDANFDGASNVNEPVRLYLCRWGAVNVPGGCMDTAIGSGRAAGSSSQTCDASYPITTTACWKYSPRQCGNSPACIIAINGTLLANQACNISHSPMS